MALLVSVVALGQTTTATLSGVVKDASGALVPDVKVTARNAATGATRDTRTDSEGRYSLTNLGPGQYEVRAERTGFKTAAQSGVILTVGGATVLDLTVQIGEVTEVVEVKQEEPLIEPTKAELSRVVTSDPSNRSRSSGVTSWTSPSFPAAWRRDARTPAEAPSRSRTPASARRRPRLTFGGQSELSTLILVDGADNIQNATGLPRVTPSQEAVREFRVLNSTFLAEYGRARRLRQYRHEVGHESLQRLGLLPA